MAVQVPHKSDKKSGEQCRPNANDPSPVLSSQSCPPHARIVGTGPPRKTPLEHPGLPCLPGHPTPPAWSLQRGQRALRTLTQAGRPRLRCIVTPIERHDLSPAVPSLPVPARPAGPSNTSSPQVRPCAPENGSRDFFHWKLGWKPWSPDPQDPAGNGDCEVGRLLGKSQAGNPQWSGSSYTPRRSPTETCISRLQSFQCA